MWITLNDSFLSVVACRGRRTKLLVRARLEGDIERVFPRATVRHTPTADYPFRAYVLRTTVARAIARRILDVDYDNFKHSIVEHDRHAAATRCWYVMRQLQADRARATAHPVRPDFPDDEDDDTFPLFRSYLPGRGAEK